MNGKEVKTTNSNDVAIIGLSGRFPGAENVNSFWDIIKDGQEEILYYSKEELLEKGVDPELLNNPAYVRADSLIESADKFDSSFFGYSPREADFMDPQHRVFLEECYSALENSGYDPGKFDGEIGVFAGCSNNRYLIKNLSQHHEVLNSLGELQTIVNNDKDFLTTRVSYKLNLKGPSVDIQTACSTSLVAVHFACQSLITHQCDMALGGGVYIKAPRHEGYIYEEGSIDSSTGHCRPFDKDANGTIFGEGVGVVVLKRLEDAIHDRDAIVAVIKATAINNDGSLKVGYMAPGVSGQVKVITKAFDLAGIDPDTITYIETHGTGTKMGDPIEVEALKRVFSGKSERKNYCALGSVKANIGHLDAAAGVTGLIKTALVLKNRQIPPLINFATPNPELDLENSPFYITKELQKWDTGTLPRRAAVNSFGIGGTNSHAILEEWITKPSEPSSKRFHLLPISAKTDGALQRMYDNLISHLGQTTDNIADIAYTLQNGRKEFKNRGILVWDNSDGNTPVFSDFPYFKGTQKLSDPRTVFMFTGQGSQYANMARGLYEHFDSVKTIMDYADALLNANHNFNLLEIIFCDDEKNKEVLNQTSVAQPTLFVVQYAVAHLLMEFGVMPNALTGHSIGEITAACLSGVFTFEDALNLVAWRGRLMQEQVPGSMLSINLSKDQIIPLLTDNVELALINAPNFCVVSGSFSSIDLFEKKISDAYPACRHTRLKTSHAFHSQLMEPAIVPFLKVLKEIKFGSVNIPFISNVTGTWITDEAAINPEYWASHIRSTVNFSDGISELLKDENSIFIEVGPGNTLSMLLSQFPVKAHLTSLSTLRHPKQTSNDLEFFFNSLTSYWINGGNINWEYIYADEERYRVSLPVYPFERRKHWVEPKVQYNYHLSPKHGQVQTDQTLIPGTESIEIGAGASDLLHNRPVLDNEFVAPESKIEIRVAAIWEELLGIKGIGVTDNFFFLGGHSLLASQIINRVNEEFNSGITIEKFFNFPTIRGLIDNEVFEEKSREKGHLMPETDFSLPLPLSPSQERLWIINQIDNNNPAYNISFSYIFEGILNKKIFRESLEVLFNRHKVLKSCIKTEESGPIVILNQVSGIHFLEKDYSGVSDLELDNKIQEFIKNESRSEFSLENCNLFRIALLNLGKERYLFSFTVHHLIFDGWSWGIFTKELKEIYNSLLKGEKVKLEPLPLDYFQYAISSRQDVPDEKYKSAKEYWKNKLEGISGQLNFPLDYKRKEISSGEGGRVALDAGTERSEKLREYSKKENVTLYMLFLSAFGFLLSRYSGDKDLCLGSPTANRPVSKLEKLIGLFINSIVLRLQINEDLSFSELLKKVKTITLEALSNQDLPFETLVDILQPDRILNMNPIFQVMFAWQNAPRPPLDLDGINSSRVFQKDGVSPLDITFYAWEENGSVLGEFEFCTDILKRSTVESLKENFICLLDHIIENPEIPLKDISIISNFEKSRLAEFNNTDVFVPNILLQELFTNKVKSFSDKTAIEVILSGESIKYSDLEKRTNQLAHHLRRKGFRQGNIAGISMDRSISMVVAVLGVLKAGGTYLPLDPAFPDDRLFYMLEDSGATALITEEIYRDRFKNSKTIITALDTEHRKIARRKSSELKINFDPHSFAYIIYTSGSTGKPKGVKVHHQAVVNFINSMSKIPGLVPEDKLLAVTTLSFDISILEIFLPLSFGATIYIADIDHISDGEMLARIIRNNHISIMQATPATWTILLTSGWKGEKDFKALCGGEALQPSLARDLLGKIKSLWNMYGPTETTVWSSCELITDYEQILVGKPIDNTQFHILHSNQEQPVGAIGELCIGGMGVTKGYHNREELTREKFFTWNNKILYRTGDLARFLDNGKVELFGRTDNQIKLRGYRIEPGEIEFELSLIDGVKEAIVKLEKFSALDERLIGYLCVNDSFNLNREQIIRSIESRLPIYMIPSLFVTKTEFPRTLNGKIDRKSLTYSALEVTDEAEEVADDFSEIELSIAKIFQDILKMKNTKKNKNFFDIGGNSLLAIRGLNRIKEELGVKLTFRELISNPSIYQLAILVEDQIKKPEKAIELVHLTETTNLPLSINQKRLWLISKLQPDIPSYIIPFTYQLLGSLDRDLFQKSLELLFQRHHIVFSLIKEIDGEPYCDIVPSKVNVSFIDYSGLPENEKEKNVNEIINTDSTTVFNLSNGPLYRLYLIKTNPAEHYFHVSIHHIIFDGWSWSVLVNDLSEIYNSLLNGKEILLEKIEFQQYDYAHWEKNFADFENKTRLIDFWKENLNGASPILNFPYDYKRLEQTSGKGSYEIIRLSQDLSEKLRSISKSEGSSLFTTLLSVFGIQLHKYSGEDDLNIGLPLTYRPHSKLENIFGMFVNTVVVRLKFEKDVTFTEILRQANEASLNAIAHQELPFENIVEIVNPERTSNANPLFQICFVWQNNLSLPIKLDNIQSKRISEKSRTSLFDITMYLWENGEIIEGEIEYNLDLLKEETIIRLRDNFIHLLETVVEDPERLVSDISIVSEEDKRKLAEFNKTDVPIPDCSLQDFFEKQSDLRSQKIAVISGESSLTYGELEIKSNQLARHLIAMGAQPGDTMGLCIERSVEMIISLLGILKAGCCYLPLDPLFPDDRIHYMLTDSNAKILISQRSLKKKIKHFTKIPVVLIDTDSKKIERHSSVKPELQLTSLSPVYIIYTSGSTGKPKGVQVHHKAVVNLIESMSKVPGVNENDILLAVVTLSFDMSVFELFVPLSIGATIVIASSQDITDGTVVANLIEKHNISVIQATPSFWNILLSSGWQGKSNLRAYCGGEALTSSLVHQILPKVSEFWNCYGPTETTVYSACMQITDLDAPILIGKPINNTVVHILDKNNRPLPVGVTGEVAIGGLGVTKGYINKPELTNEKFITLTSGVIVYKTGDLGRFITDGNIELFGRSDNQIKLRGFRIEPGEIENLITHLPEVKEAVVKLHRFEDNDERLVAFLNVDAGFTMTKEEITGYLVQHLPSYMIPSFFQTSDGFPRLPNGKINKKELLYKIKDSDQKYDVDFDSLTETQKKLIAIWGDILKTINIRPSGNFFDIGGNSLLAIRSINKIKEEFGFTLSFRELIANPTINQLSILIDGQKNDSVKAIELVHLTETRNLPLTKNQKRLWIISRLQPDVPSYIIPFTYKLSGSLDQKLFQNSLEILFQRHHIVFSVIREKNGEPYCDIVQSKVNISYIDYSGLPENEKPEKINEIVNADSRKVFDLKNGPLFRLYLIQTNAGEYYFHLSIHHIVFDGWSWPVFVNDLSVIYNSLLNRKAIKLEGIEFQQYDYAYWELNSAKSETENELIEFWKENLKESSPVLNFPYDFPRKERSSGKGSFEIIQLTRVVSDKLRKISKNEDSSLFATMLNTFGILMHKYSGEDDINIGLPVAYRPHSKLENIFGMFVNTVVVRLKFERDFSFKKLLRQVNEATLNAIAHQKLPFESIVEIVNPERNTNANPLFQVCFVWQNNLNIPMNLEGIRSTRISEKERTTPFDIGLYMWENNGIIEGEIEYNTDLIKYETIIRLKENFLNLINNLVENSDIPIDSVPVITDEDKKMIDSFNDTLTDYPKNKTIVQLFEEQASIYPDNKAVVFKGESLTYRQLNEKSNQLARTMREAGVTRNTPVGIIAEKSLDIIVGILGILKAGGAYVPIDPDYPEQRINFIVSDSGCSIILIQDRYMELRLENVAKINLNSPKSYHKKKADLENINNSSDLGYIMYTSGTTGKPKGSMIRQYGIVRLVRNTNYLNITSEDRVLLTSAIVFDVATFEIWGALLNGASLYIVEKETILNPKALGKELIENNITVLWLTSALFTQIAEARTDIFGKLKYLLAGGDVLSAPHINKVRKDNPGLKVINGYGPTENTTFSTTYLIEKDFEYNVPIGKPISNSTAYIFDKNMKYQPIGVIGELFVGGDGVSMGYLNRDDLNKLSFMDHPSIPAERLYRTGDYAKWFPDGNIEFHGRIDNQLKIRGFRVELGEIESVISEIEGVIETVIKPVRAAEGDYRLIAFLNVSETFNMEPVEIGKRIKAKLPPYMVPSAFKFMHGFPKTINGKIDRKALEYDMAELESKGNEEIKSLTPAEKVIFDIWSKSLKTSDISASDNFFEIGGNSLMAISVFSKIETAFNIELGLRVFFDSPRIKDLAEIIDIKLQKSAERQSVSQKEGAKSKTLKGEI